MGNSTYSKIYSEDNQSIGSTGRTAATVISKVQSVSTFSGTTSFSSTSSKQSKPNKHLDELIGDSYITELVRKENWTVLSKLLDENPSWASETVSSIDNLIPIHIAIIKSAPAWLIAKLIDKYPEGSSVDDNEGKLPLHFAMIHQSPLDVVQMLLSSYPAGIQHKTDAGRLPIHYAIECSPNNVELISLLSSNYSLGVGEYCDGKCALHFCCEYKSNLAIFELLHSYYPNGIREKGIDGMTPIHLAVSNRSPFAVVERLIKLNPDALTDRDRLGRLPLHYSLEKKSSDDIILALLEAAPQTASYRGFGGCLPLHTAVEKHASSNVIKRLIDCFCDAAKEKDMFGILPLQYSMKNSQMTKEQELIIMELIQAYPNGVEAADEYKRIALHYAVSRKLPVVFIQKLIDVYPVGASIRDQDNQLALHLAFKRNADQKVIELLIQAYPDGVMAEDNFRFLPIHYGIELNVPVEKIQLLVDRNNECLKFRSHDKLALHLAVEFKRSLEVIKAVGDGYVDAAQDREHKKGRLPICWAMERRLSIDIVMYLYSLFPGRQCAVLEDYFGLLPIHYAIKFHSEVDIVQKLLESFPDIARSQTWPLHNIVIKQPVESIDLDESSPSSESKSLRNSTSDGVDNNSSRSTNHLTSSSDKNPQKAVSVKAKNTTEPPESSGLIAYGKRRRELNGRMLIHFAVEDMEALPKTVAEILQLTMPLKPDTETPYPDHYFSWTYILSEANDRYHESVDIILQRYEHKPSLVQYLSRFPDEQGNKSIDIATPKCKHELLIRMYYFGKYDIQAGPYLHKSTNSLVRLAIDHSDVEKRLVALKFMSNRLQFDREVNLRNSMGISANQWVVPIIKFFDSDGDMNYRLETKKKGFGVYPYLIVMLAADRDLQSIIIHEHFAGGRDWNKAKQYAIQILQNLSYLHSRGIVHGDIKPLNLLRQDNRIKLIDLGASVNHAKKERAGVHKTSQAYLPPEMIALLLAQNEHVEENVKLSMNNASPTWVDIGGPAPMSTFMQCDRRKMLTDTDTSVAGDPSIDMWSFGVVLYQICTGEPLFTCDIDDNMGDQRYLKLLADWPDRFKNHKLAKVADHQCRNLLFQLLSKNAHRRPTADKCLQHVFFTGLHHKSRFPGEVPTYDLFISHKTRNLKAEASLLQSMSCVTDEFPGSELANTTLKTDSAVDNRLHVKGGREEGGHNHESDEDEADDENSDELDECIPIYDDDAHIAKLSSLLRGKGLSVVSSKECIVNHTRTLIHEVSRNDTVTKIGMGDGEKPAEDSSFLSVEEEVELSDKIAAAAVSSLLVGNDLTTENVINDDMFNSLLSSTIKMINSKAAVFVLSRYAINNYLDGSTLEKVEPNDSVNQIYFEMRLAIELVSFGLLEKGISVILIGDITKVTDGASNHELRHHVRKNALHHQHQTEDDLDLMSRDSDIFIFGDSGSLDFAQCEYSMYFASFEGDPLGKYGSCHPSYIANCQLLSVEHVLRKCLDNQHLGTPTYPDVTVPDILADIISHQSFLVTGNGNLAWSFVADDIYLWCSDGQEPQFNIMNNLNASSYSGNPERPFTAESIPRTPKSPMLPTTPSRLTMSTNNGLLTGEVETISLFERADADLAEISLLQGESVALTFLQGKLANKNIEVENLRIEMDLMQRQLDIKNQDLIRLRHRFNIDDR